MFSAPTAIRVLKKQDPAFLKKYDLSSLKFLFLAGEPLDQPTAQWISDGLGRPIIDNYWQTETGWPILANPMGVEDIPRKFGSPGFPMYGYDLKLLHESTGEEVGTDEKGVVAIVPPLPPGCMSTVWGDDERFVKTYFETIPGRLAYSTFDWGIRDKDGYYFILGRTDDVINVAGHRLGTREIEEAISSHPAIAEVAVIGVADQLKGQVPVAFAVLKDPSQIAGSAAADEARRRSDEDGGPAARRHRPAGAGAFRHAAAEDALGQGIAPFDSGAVRRTRPGRPYHHRGSGRTAAGARRSSGKSVNSRPLSLPAGVVSD